jgi:PAS domain S-box-containing protein
MVFDGRSGKAYENAAVVMHAALPKGKTAVIGIINIFEPSEGDVLTFRGTGFSAAEVLVNGKSRSFPEYIAEKKLDTKLPLVANYGGAMINVSFREVDAANGKVEFFAPLFKGVQYRHAKPLGDYLQAFLEQKPQGIEDRLMFSCNCVLNYLYSGLEGKRTTGFTGPITFGEVGYQLLNQTAVYLEIVTANLAERLRAETAARRSQRMLATLMDTMPDPVFYKDADLRLRGCNKAYEEFAGLPKEKILGRTVHDIFPPEVARVFTARNDELLPGGGSRTYELGVPDRSGGLRHTVVHTATFTASGGRVGGIVGVISDVTELRRASDELKLFRDLIESSTDAIMISLPEDGRLIDVNHSACERFGYSRLELLGMKVPDIRTGLPRAEDWRELVARIRSAPFLLEEVPHRRKNGETFPAEVNVKYVTLNGKDYLVAILRDITERKKMEAAMQEVQTLQGLIPICAGCKKIRNDKGYWERVETYISQRSTVRFSHGLCEECTKKIYGNEEWFKASEHKP